MLDNEQAKSWATDKALLFRATAAQLLLSLIKVKHCTCRLQQRMVVSLDELATIALFKLTARSVTSPSCPRQDLSNCAVCVLHICATHLDCMRTLLLRTAWFVAAGAGNAVD